MRSLLRITALFFLAALLGVAGCQKVNVNKTYTLNPGDVNILIVDPPSREQEVVVSVTSSGPIDVYLAPEKDVEQANKDTKPPKNVIASKTAIEKDSFTGKVPAKVGYGIVLLNAKNKNTTVTVDLNAK